MYAYLFFADLLSRSSPRLCERETRDEQRERENYLKSFNYNALVSRHAHHGHTRELIFRLRVILGTLSDFNTYFPRFSQLEAMLLFVKFASRNFYTSWSVLPHLSNVLLRCAIRVLEFSAFLDISTYVLFSVFAQKKNSRDRKVKVVCALRRDGRRRCARNKAGFFYHARLRSIMRVIRLLAFTTLC